MVKVIGDAVLDDAGLRLCRCCLAMMSECLPDRWVDCVLYHVFKGVLLRCLQSLLDDSSYDKMTFVFLR